MSRPFDVLGRALRGAVACPLAVGALLALGAPPASAQPTTTLYVGQSGSQLASSVRAGFTPNGTLGYNAARDQLFAYEQQTDGGLEGIYTGYTVQLSAGADPSTDAYNKGINTEHTWPQSQGAGSEPAKSDMHHLFPAKTNVNSARGSYPFAEIPDAQADAWYRLAASQASTPSSNLSQWSEKDNAGTFEPRESVKGDIARAMLYFYTIYQSAASDSFWNGQKDVLLAWHAADPVDWEEYNRSEWIETKQGKANPFILDPSLANRIYGDGTGGGGTGGGGSTAALWINELHYDDYSTDANEGVEVAGPAGTSLSGWTVVAYNGNGGAAYKTVGLSGTIDDEQNGVGAVWIAISGLQNGAPDGVALVNPSGQAVQLLSYEGAFTAADGAASGQTSQNIGRSETSSTPDGYSLQLTGSGDSYSDFAWQNPRTASRGSLNAGQSISGSDGSTGGGSTGGTPEWRYETVSAQTPHAYPNNWNNTYTYRKTGAERVALYFEQFELEANYDYVYVKDAAGTTRATYTGTKSAFWAIVDGDEIDVNTVTDYSVTDYGWRITQAAYYAGSVLRVAASDPPLGFEPKAAASDEARLMGTKNTPTGLALAVSPNPTAGTATVRLESPVTERLTVAVYDVLGREVARLHDGAVEAGAVQFAFDGAALPAGLYVIRAASEAGVVTERLTVTR
jgi:hypothetical protein